MKKNKTFVTVMLLIAVVMLGVGYAAISGIELVINGSASATTNDSNFVVKFAASPAPVVGVSNDVTIPAEKTIDDYVTAEVTGDLTAKFTVKNLDTAGQYATITYTVKNLSPELKANLTLKSVQNTNETYFLVETVNDNPVIDANGTTTFTIKVRLIKTPATDNVSATITVMLDAEAQTA